MTVALSADPRRPARHHAAGWSAAWVRPVAAVVFYLALAFAGGASRPDEEAQAIVRATAILAILSALWEIDPALLARRPRVLLAAAAVWLLPLLQLVPLPPSLWAVLPGHALGAEVARAAGAVGWRPLSLAPDLTLDAVLGLLPPSAALLLALPLQARRRGRLLTSLILATAGVSALLGLLQRALPGLILSPWHERSADAAIGLFANRNHQAVLLACALPFVPVWAARRLREGKDPTATGAAAGLAASLCLLGLVLTGSRMGLLLGGAGVLAAAGCWRAAGHKLLPASVAARAGVAGGLGILVTALAVLVARGDAVARLAAGPGADTRLSMLPALVRTGRAFLPLGAGFGAFDPAWRQFEPTALLSTIYMNQAHDEPLQLLIEGGLPAMLLLGGYLLWWTTAAGRILQTRDARSGRATALAALSATLMLMLSSLVDYPMRTPLLSSLFIVASLQMLEPLGRASASRGARRPA